MRLAPLLLISFISIAQARAKVAVLDTRKALISTQQGKAATAELHRKFDPDQARLKDQQSEIDRLKAQQADDKQIGVLVSTHRRATEEARQKFEQEQRRVYKELTDKLMSVVKEYAKKRHLEVVLDESDPATPVLWRDDKSDITDQVVKLYDLKYR